MLISVTFLLPGRPVRVQQQFWEVVMVVVGFCSQISTSRYPEDTTQGRKLPHPRRILVSDVGGVTYYLYQHANR